MLTKPDYWYKQSAAIPFRIIDNKIEVIVVRSRKNKHWIFPKGIIEKSLSSKESAVKEAFEEAGVIGEIQNKKLGKYSYKKWGGKCKVKVYSLSVKTLLNDYPESFRERKWIDIDIADEFIFDNKILKILEFLKNSKK